MIICLEWSINYPLLYVCSTPLLTAPSRRHLNIAQYKPNCSWNELRPSDAWKCTTMSMGQLVSNTKHQFECSISNEIHRNWCFHFKLTVKVVNQRFWFLVRFAFIAVDSIRIGSVDEPDLFLDDRIWANFPKSKDVAHPPIHLNRNSDPFMEL